MTLLLSYVGSALLVAGVCWLAVQPAASAPRPGRPGGFRLRRLLGSAVALLAAAHLVVQTTHQVPRLWQVAANRPDGLNYHHTVQRAARGDALYRPWPDYGPHYATAGYPYPLDRHPYPPFLTAALMPLAGSGPLEFGRAWYVVLFAAFWAYAVCLARLATGRVTPVAVLVAGCVLGVTPGAWLALLLANVEPVLWALFGAALAFPTLRGFGFTASAMVKLYCAWPLLLALRLEGWRVVRSALVALGAGVLAGCLALGFAGFFDSLRDWATYLLPVVGQGTFHVNTRFGGINLSVPLAGLRLARHLGWEYVPGPLPGWARLYLSVLGIAAPLLAVWWTRRLDRDLRYALVTVAAVAFAPIFWTTYLPLLLVPLAIWIRKTNEARAVAAGVRGRLHHATGEGVVSLH